MANKPTPIPIIYENGKDIKYVSFSISNLSNRMAWFGFTYSYLVVLKYIWNIFLFQIWKIALREYKPPPWLFSGAWKRLVGPDAVYHLHVWTDFCQQTGRHIKVLSIMWSICEVDFTRLIISWKIFSSWPWNQRTSFALWIVPRYSQKGMWRDARADYYRSMHMLWICLNFIYMCVLSYDVWMGMCWWCYACILLHEWFYMYIPAYVLSQAWLDKTVETLNHHWSHYDCSGKRSWNSRHRTDGYCAFLDEIARSYNFAME